MDRSFLCFIAAGSMALCATNAVAVASPVAEQRADGRCASRTDAAGGSGTMPLQASLLALAAHNAERQRLGLPPLTWSCQLERDAAQWARTLQIEGKFEHSGSNGRKGSGENLWMGTAGHWSIDEMVGGFLAEKDNYQNRRFPNVSRTGNWTDVGHYSQIVWRDTREVGCAVAKGLKSDVLVCRYFPAGNVMGRTAF